MILLTKNEFLLRTKNGDRMCRLNCKSAITSEERLDKGEQYRGWVASCCSCTKQFDVIQCKALCKAE